MAEIVFAGTTRRFPGAERPAVDRLDLRVRDGEFLVFVGPSGCGKTTSLRMLAGLEKIDEGAIFIDGRDVTNLAPRDRDIAMVFQSYALYPHMSVADNLSFALRVAGVDRQARSQRVQRAAQMLGLEELLDRRPRALSGGQRQRVAMGRAIVRQPQAFLMDEPLSNLDAQLRVFTRAEIHRLQRDLGVTTVYVTHDQVEAMTMGDRVAVMRDGVLQQIDTPPNIYDYPANLFVAGFMGSPSMNLIEARVTAAGERTTVAFGRHTLAVGSDVNRMRRRLASYAGRKIIVGIRPEDFTDPRLVPATDARALIEIRCDLREALGSDILVHFAVESTSCVARLSPQSSVSEGETVSLGVEVNRLHFFDPETGVAIESASA